ncbi:MAG: hypothetical protein C0498_12530 [Anaerolinea sp.]|nr:hypothetical protein [Anaerolinea sp.]
MLLCAVVAATAGGCIGQWMSDIAPSSPKPDLVIELETPDGSAGLARRVGGLDLFITNPDGTFWKATSVRDRPRETTVYLMVGGDTSWVFGNAPIGAANVEVSIAGAQATLRSGLYIVSVPKSVMPSEVSWRFVAADGTLIVSGIGLLE